MTDLLDASKYAEKLRTFRAANMMQHRRKVPNMSVLQNFGMRLSISAGNVGSSMRNG